ncbi:hypothetical protein V1512DRAFT_262656 [Lipomyces arxii]|uniref:uncharacterized protein n=1 Tax=Lipomyces arxii TaxID=56418 RepID=UPI0034CF24D2
MESMFTVNDKIVLVTGGSRGLGLYAAHALLVAGASQVYISSRKAIECDKSAKALNAIPGVKGKAIPIAGNFSTLDGVKTVMEFVKTNSGGKLDIVIANAGTTWGAPFEKHLPDMLDKVLDLNLKGVFYTIQQAASLLEATGTAADPARVIVVGSIIGLAVTGGGTGTYGYLSSKAAVHHLSKALAVELGPRHINVNVIAPGFFPTKMGNGLINMIGTETLAEVNPTGRLGLPEDIEGAVLYLCSKAGAYINGVVLPIDGGQHLVSKL